MSRNVKIIIGLMTPAILLLGLPAESGDSRQNAVVQIHATLTKPNPSLPWQREGAVTSSGSGVVIGGGKVLTAAHVVAGAAMIEVESASLGKRFTATLEHICHDCDLALLRVSDDEFDQAVKPARLGDLAKPQQQVEVLGFPIGGEGLSTTSGIVSRILVGRHAQSPRPILLAQVDAPINPGNSGGPAFTSGKIAGIAVAGLDDADNIGYLVPTPVIRHFLKDVEDGSFDGIPVLGLQTQPLRNPAFRRKLGLKGVEGGVFVTGVYSGSSAAGAIEPGDVLLGIRKTAIGEDGKVALSDQVRVDAKALELDFQVGQKAELQLSRNGRQVTTEVSMRPPRVAIPLGEFEQDIPYRIYAGLVFQRLSVRYVAEWDQPPAHLEAYGDDPPRAGFETHVHPERVPVSEVVLISRVLHNDLTRGYDSIEDEVVYAINSTQVRSLNHLSELLDQTSGEFVTITLARGKVLVFDRKEVEDASEKILAQYHVDRDRSLDLEKPVASQGPTEHP